MGVLNTGCLLQRRGKKEGQEKQDLHKRVGMDIEDGWHLHKHTNAHIHSITSVLPDSGAKPNQTKPKKLLYLQFT